jgi:hypothetical protein
MLFCGSSWERWRPRRLTCARACDTTKPCTKTTIRKDSVTKREANLGRQEGNMLKWSAGIFLSDASGIEDQSRAVRLDLYLNGVVSLVVFLRCWRRDAA